MNGNSRRRSGTSTRPLARPLIGRQDRSIATPSSRISPRYGRAQARQREHQRAFAGGIGADEADDLAGVHRQVDAVQHLHRRHRTR